MQKKTKEETNEAAGELLEMLDMPVARIEWNGKKLIPRLKYSVIRDLAPRLKERGIETPAMPYIMQSVAETNNDPMRAIEIMYLVLLSCGELEPEASEEDFQNAFDDQKITIDSLSKMLSNVVMSSFLVEDRVAKMEEAKKELKKKINGS